MYEFDWMLHLGIFLFGAQCAVFALFTIYIILYIKNLVNDCRHF